MSRWLATVAVLSACGNDMRTTDEPTETPAYRDINELFDQGFARTCSLNNGVCHNSKSYPDLHTVTGLIGTIDQPCNSDTTDPVLIHDACESAADRLVIPSAGIDVRIVSATLAPSEQELDVRNLTQVTLVLDPAPTGLTVGATDTEVRRDATIFAVGEYGARVASVNGAEVVLDLRSAYGETSTRRFFDVRVQPPGPLRIHVGDPNGNGIQGARTTTMPLIAVGDPDGSYLMRRLVDDSFGELMPRQCRTWDDRANRALGCWIAGLRVDDDGAVINAFDPIDYAGCSIEVEGLGKCTTPE
ncbi:MAG: hypothetical protein H0T42_24540 [Deltaproteobacteria bacterium]|nr:hypothetical protein [Deltaproteobacteria bacterium]